MASYGNPGGVSSEPSEPHTRRHAHLARARHSVIERQVKALPTIVTRAHQPLVYTNEESDDHAVDKDNTLLRDVQAMKAFFGYLDFDKPQKVLQHIHSSGKNTENTAWSTHNRFMSQLEKRGEANTDDAVIYVKSSEEVARTARNDKIRRRKLKKARMDLLRMQGLTPHALIEEVRKVFHIYCRSSAGGAADHDDEIETVEFHRLLRDTRLLDNGFSFTEADTLFIEKDHAKGGDVSSVPGDFKLDFDEFIGVCDQIGKIRFPTMKDAAQRRKGVLIYYILPFAKASCDPHPVDALLTREAMCYLHEYDTVCKQIYAHYATLDMTFHSDTCWDNVRRKNLTLNIDEFMMSMINFEVVPCLLSKTEILAVFRLVERENDADEEVDEMNLPAFVEVLLRLATLAATKVHSIITNHHSSVTELSAAKKLLYHADKHVQRQYEPILHARGHALKGKLNFARRQVDYTERMWKQVHAREEQERAQQEEARMRVQLRREEIVSKSRLNSGRGAPTGHPHPPAGGKKAGGAQAHMLPPLPPAGGLVLKLPPPNGDLWSAPARDPSSRLEGADVPLPALPASARKPEAPRAAPPPPGGRGAARRGRGGKARRRHRGGAAALTPETPGFVGRALDDFEERLPAVKFTRDEEEMRVWESTIRGAPPAKIETKRPLSTRRGVGA